VAKKSTPPAPPPPTPERVARALRAGDYGAALETARALHALSPTPDALALRRRTLAAAAGYFADHDRAADFNRAMAEADALDQTDPAWTVERACLLARGGRAAEALERVEEADRPRVVGHIADRAVRIRVKDFLPPELHAGFDAILAAFGYHEAGNEAAARAALEAVGLRSPFLDWKMLLRGLLAHAAADDARAAENFARLDPARLPARLAAPLRAAVDPAFQAALPAETAAALAARRQKLTAGPTTDLLRAIARELGRDKPLAPAFRAAGEVLPHLKKDATDLVPRLANCLYHAVAAQGQPDDLPRFRKLFGDPPDDPGFHRLQAVITEQIGDPPRVHAHWQKFEAWLATGPAGWPPPQLARARAVVWERMGENARHALDADDDDPADPFGLFAPSPRRKKPKPLDPPAEACFRKAAALAPDWPVAAGKLFETLVEAGKPAEAEAEARTFLAAHPDDLFTLTSLAGLVQAQGRAADAAGLWLRALALNPLDKATRFLTASAVLGAARRKLTEGDGTAAAAVLDRHDSLLAEQVAAGLPGLRAVILMKLGRPDAAAAQRDQALAVPGARLGAAYRMMVDGQLAKLKPADKKAADQRFAAELAGPPTPHEVNQLIAAYDMYHIDGVAYRGQKTHEKKVFDQAARCVAAKAPEVDFERLAGLFVGKYEWKYAKKFADACLQRFPANPALLLARSEAGLGTNEREYHVEGRLRRAKELAEASAEPRYRALAARIDEVLKEVATPFDFLGGLFGRE